MDISQTQWIDANIMFLMLSLIFPRLVLFFGWVTNTLPYNSTPFAGDVIMSIFLPRILILIWIGQGAGMNNMWFFFHVIAAIAAYVVNINIWNSRYNKA